MKKLVSALIQTLPEFVNVGIFLGYIFVLFAILGVHLYNGIFYNACRFNPEPETEDTWAIDTSIESVCTKSGTGTFHCPADRYCGNPADFNLPITPSTVNLKPFTYYGIHNFNDLANSLQVVFQIVTAESWSTYMYNLMSADSPILATIFTISIVALGSLYLMNLILTVIIQTFVSITEKEIAEEAAKLNERAQEGEAQFIAEEVMEMIKEEGEEIVSESSIMSDGEEGSGGGSPCKSADKRKNGPSQRRSLLEVIQEKDDTDRQNLCNQKKSGGENFETPRLQDVSSDHLLSDREGGSQMKQPTFLKERSKQKQVINVFKLNNNTNSSGKKEEKNEISPTFGVPIPSEAGSQQGKQNSSMLKIDENNMGIDLNKKIEEIANAARKSLDIEESALGDQPQNHEQKEAMASYLHKKLTKEKRRTLQFNKLVERQQTKKVDMVKEGGTGKIVTLRDLTQERVGMGFKRMQMNLSRHDTKLKIIYRSQLNRFYFLTYQIAKNKYFQFTVSLIIVLNTIILALDKYPEGDIQKNRDLDKLNIGFSIFFMIEAFVKVAGLGVKGYVSDKYNVFDAFIVLGSIIDIVMSLILNYSSRGVMTVLRSFRLMRIFKLAKQWKRLDHLLQTIGRTLNDIGTFSILMMLFMLSFSLLGMELFANKVRFDSDNNLDLEYGEPPSSNYDTLLNAFTTVFIVLTADGWSGIYFAHRRAIDNVVPTIYFNLLIVIGQKVLLNLFLAILLQNFDENNMLEQIDKEMKQQNLELVEASEIQNGSSNMLSMIKKAACCLVSLFEEEVDEEEQPHFKAQISLNQRKESSPERREEALSSKKTPNFGGQMTSNSSYVEIQGKSLYLFSEESILRNKIMELVRHQFFEIFILITIIISSVQLAIDSPLLDPNGDKSLNLYIVDTFTTTIFAVEAILKIVSLGFALNGKYSYLRNPWNLADFIILILSIIALTPLSTSLQIFKMFRILRILRLISRNERLKVAAKALLYALPNILNVTIIIVFFFLIFGIVCVSYFKGKFFICDQSFETFSVYSITDSELFITEPFTVNDKWDCLTAGGDWVNSPSTFDNLYFAMNTLFIMATASGWSDLMYFCSSATDIDQVQVPRNNNFWIIFYIIYMIISCFFLLNLFVGVVISTFNSETDKLGGTNLLTSKQKEWIEAKVMILKAKPMRRFRPPSNVFRQWMFRVHQHRWYENAILVCIVLNTVVLALKWYGQPNEVYVMTEALNYLFTAVFILEAVIKISAFGFYVYFSDGWNIFDFLIVITSLVSIFLSFTSTVSIKGAVTIVRAFRIMRVVRLIKRARSLKVIFNTFIVSLPALANIGGMLLLILYLYSILAMELFGSVKRNGIFSDDLNFETFSNSFCALCAVATADSWSNIMQASLQQYSPQFQCTYSPSYEDYEDADYSTVGCGKSYSGVLFFYSFYLFVNLIFLNLFIAIILQGFLETQLKDQRLFNAEMLTHFKEVWAEFDEDATSFIKLPDLRRFLIRLGSPFGFDRETLQSKPLQDRFIAALNLPTYNSMSDYQFMDVLDAISMRLMVINITKNKENEGRMDSIAESVEGDKRDTEQRQQENRVELEKEINKLILNDNYAGITSFKEIKKIESRIHYDTRLNAQKDGNFTSAHVATAEWAFARMKRFLKIKQRDKRRMQRKVTRENELKKLSVNQANAAEAIKHEPHLLHIDISNDKIVTIQDSYADEIQVQETFQNQGELQVMDSQEGETSSRAFLSQAHQDEQSNNGGILQSNPSKESDAQPGFESDKTVKEREQLEFYEEEAEEYPQNLMIRRQNNIHESSPSPTSSNRASQLNRQRLKLLDSPIAVRRGKYPQISVGLFGHAEPNEQFENEDPSNQDLQFYPIATPSEIDSRSVTPTSAMGATQGKGWMKSRIMEFRQGRYTAKVQQPHNQTHQIQRRPSQQVPDLIINNSQEEFKEQENTSDVLMMQDFSSSQLIQLDQSLEDDDERGNGELAFSKTQGLGALSKKGQAAQSTAALHIKAHTYQRATPVPLNVEDRSHSNPSGRWQMPWKQSKVVKILTTTRTFQKANRTLLIRNPGWQCGMKRCLVG
ncbi:hypothetical protein FGO68_gene16047 [Halteria grandinella]|uniref:EF-hand domain-containing protein n=1 Tax=Halteria grandinella TaxID=5974 RepID=A0A8J8TB19_HALGN|nr:hypothetical protein FGO68_gene16047 [Halteria grandinella]